MKQQPIDALQPVFRQAQVDLPPGLKARLLAIPALDQQPAFGYLNWLLPLLALIPGFLWMTIRFGADLMEFVAGLTRGLILLELPRLSFLTGLFQSLALSELSLPAPPTITPLMVYIFMATAAAITVMALGWYLWHESQLDAQHLYAITRRR